MIHVNQLTRGGPIPQSSRRFWTSAGVFQLWSGHMTAKGLDPNQARDFTLVMELCKDGNTKALYLMMRLLQSTQLPAVRAAVAQMEAMLREQTLDD